jgi:hypothetical protein
MQLTQYKTYFHLLFRFANINELNEKRREAKKKKRIFFLLMRIKELLEIDVFFFCFFFTIISVYISSKTEHTKINIPQKKYYFLFIF